MFGGLAFLVGGHMAVAVSGQGGLMVRVPADGDGRAAFEDLDPGRHHGADLRGDLDEWLGVGISVARSLPPRH